MSSMQSIAFTVRKTAAVALTALGLVALASLALADELPIAKMPETETPAPWMVAPAPEPEVVTLVPKLQLPAELSTDHMLYPVVQKIWRGEFGEQPAWKLSLLLQGLKEEPRTAKFTAYSSRCPDGGGPHTRWGTRVRYGICAADPRYWGPGSVIWVGAPVERILIVEDTGSAIKGKHRFDISFNKDAAACSRFGVRRLEYIPLYAAPPTRRWGSKPRGWTPPAPPVQQILGLPSVPTPQELAVEGLEAQETG